MADHKNPGRPVIRVRVEAPEEIVEYEATALAEIMVERGYEVLDQTGINPNRNEPGMARVYITAR